MRSIRRRLLWSLVILFSLAWLSLAVVIFFASKHEIEELFDAELSRSAGMMADLGVETLEEMSVHDERAVASDYGHVYEKKISFQIWKADHLRLRSESAPRAPLAERTGFSDHRIDGTVWRVFGLYLKTSGCRLYVAEDYAVRNELIGKILWRSLLPFVWSLPLLVLLLHFGIRRGLAPLNRVAGSVARRGPEQMEAVDDRGAPEEVQPLIVAINTLLARLRTAFEQERRFNADAAHELKTPLASIRVHAQLAQRTTQEAERRQALAKVIRGVDRSAHLVRQMLTLARLEPEAAERDFEPVELAEIAYEIVNEQADLATDRRITLDCVADAQPVEGYQILGSETSLRVLLSNLVDNAIRHTPAGGRVRVELARTPGVTRLSVGDSGPGIAEAERQRVFDRFYRSPGQDDYGCGLGLSIVARIANLHSAKIQLSRDPQLHGLRVDLLFPAPTQRKDFSSPPS